MCFPSMRLASATERACLYQMFSKLTQKETCQDLLAAHEHCYSKHLSNLVEEKDDVRISQGNQGQNYDVCANLLAMENQDLRERIMPRLRQIMDDKAASGQDRLA